MWQRKLNEGMRSRVQTVCVCMYMYVAMKAATFLWMCVHFHVPTERQRDLTNLRLLCFPSIAWQKFHLTIQNENSSDFFSGETQTQINFLLISDYYKCRI